MPRRSARWVLRRWSARTGSLSRSVARPGPLRSQPVWLPGRTVGDDGPVRRLIAALLLACILLSPGVASAQVEPATTTTLPPTPNIIPQPNSGVAPQDAGDRGGALQTVLFFAIIGATGVMVLLVVRSSRRARAERGF